MIAVAKEPFLRMGDVMRQANYSRIELIKKLPLFSEWSMAQIASLFRHCVKKEFGYNRLLYRQGERDDNIYIVLKGEVEVAARSAAASSRAGGPEDHRHDDQQQSREAPSPRAVQDRQRRVLRR
jgi:hypothetical protein